MVYETCQFVHLGNLGNAAQNRAMLRQIEDNLARQEPSNGSVRVKRKRGAVGNNDELRPVLWL